jgi:hypothetical protein
MPVEIRELHIRVAVNSDSTKPAPSESPPSRRDAAADKDAIVTECVEQVLHIIQAKRER